MVKNNNHMKLLSFLTFKKTPCLFLDTVVEFIAMATQIQARDLHNENSTWKKPYCSLKNLPGQRNGLVI